MTIFFQGTILVEKLMIVCDYTDYVAYRHPDHGSWFIKALVESFSELAKEKHLLDIMTVVSGHFIMELLMELFTY